MQFRIAAAPDIPALHKLIESAFRGDSARVGWTHEADLLGGQRTDVGALSDILASPVQSMLVAEDGDDLLGCVCLTDKGEVGGARRAYLGMLTVRPALQGAGLGRALLEEAERYAREALAARVMEMTVIRQRPELIAWYLRRGYVDSGREEPFPLDDPKFGLPKTRELVFVVLERAL